VIIGYILQQKFTQSVIVIAIIIIVKLLHLKLKKSGFDRTQHVLSRIVALKRDSRIKRTDKNPVKKSSFDIFLIWI